MAKAKYGDIIYVKQLYYRHYGIYINENCVIHYDGKQDDFWLGKMCIREATMERFLDGKSDYHVAKYKAKYSPKEVVQRAMSRIGEEDFNLVLNNCEHFSRWCGCGKSNSYQVSKVGTIMILLGLISK